MNCRRLGYSSTSRLMFSCGRKALSALLIAQLQLLVAANPSNLVTCSSVVKLINHNQDKRLHSHDIKYGSGSGQQSVTGIQSAIDANSYWVVLSATKEPCHRGSEIKCGSTIRLAHLKSGCLLHSHLFKSPLSGNQEVSCFGTNQLGDSGDHWTVLCDNQVWLRTDKVRFQHNDTGGLLGMTGHKYGRPISGHHEVCVFKTSNSQSYWTVGEGVFFAKSSDAE